MERNDFFYGVGTIVYTPQDLKNIMTSAIVGLDLFYDMANETYLATADLFGKKVFPVCVLEMSSKEDPSNIGCLICIPENNMIAFWYGKFDCVQATKNDVGLTFQHQLGDCFITGKVIEKRGKLCLEYKK